MNSPHRKNQKPAMAEALHQAAKRAGLCRKQQQTDGRQSRFSQSTATMVGRSNTRSKAAAESSAGNNGKVTQEELEAAVQKAAKDILTEMMKDHRKQTNEAIGSFQESAQSVHKELGDQLAALVERVGDLESNKENNQSGPVEGHSFSNKGIYHTMEEMHRHKDGEIKVRMTG